MGMINVFGKGCVSLYDTHLYDLMFRNVFRAVK